MYHIHYICTSFITTHDRYHKQQSDTQHTYILHAKVSHNRSFTCIYTFHPQISPARAILPAHPTIVPFLSAHTPMISTSHVFASYTQKLLYGLRTSGGQTRDPLRGNFRRFTLDLTYRVTCSDRAGRLLLGSSALSNHTCGLNSAHTEGLMRVWYGFPGITPSGT